VAVTNQKNLNRRELKKSVSEGSIEPVYLFHGNQIELIEDSIGLIKKALFGAGSEPSYSVFYGDDCTAEEVVQTCATAPMFSDKRLCVLKAAEKLDSAALGILEAYFESPAPSTCLVVVWSGGKPKFKLSKVSSVAVVDFSLKGGEIIESVLRLAETLGVTLTAQAARLMTSLVGEDLQVIKNELSKLALFAGDGEEITSDIVEEFVTKSQYDDIFELINSVSTRDKKRALKVLTHLQARREEPLMVLGMLAWRFRLLWRAKELIQSGATQNEIIKRLGVSPGALKYIRGQEKGFSVDDFLRINEVLSEGDRLLKSSTIPPSFTLTKIVLELCS